MQQGDLSLAYEKMDVSLTIWMRPRQLRAVVQIDAKVEEAKLQAVFDKKKSMRRGAAQKATQDAAVLPNHIKGKLVEARRGSIGSVGSAGSGSRQGSEEGPGSRAGSQAGSQAGSRAGSRRGSVDTTGGICFCPNL